MEGGEGNVRKSRNFRCIIRCRNSLLCLIESGRSGEDEVGGEESGAEDLDVRASHKCDCRKEV